MEGGVLRARVTGRVGQGHGSCGPGSRGHVGQGHGSCRPGSRAMWVGVTGHVCQGHGSCGPGSRGHVGVACQHTGKTRGFPMKA